MKSSVGRREGPAWLPAFKIGLETLLQSLSWLPKHLRLCDLCKELEMGPHDA